MKSLITAVAVTTAALASGCATYDSQHYASAKAAAAANPSVVVAEGDNGATPYRQQSMFFKDRGLHQEVPSALVPRTVEPPPAG